MNNDYEELIQLYLKGQLNERGKTELLDILLRGVNSMLTEFRDYKIVGFIQKT